MKCEACEFEQLRKENPNGIFKLLAYPHTCNQPERLNEKTPDGDAIV